MTSGSTLRKGRCPGARRPMQAKDGLIVRLKLSGGVVPADILRKLAQAGRNHGNGSFDLSARANLQLRGIREDRLTCLIEEFETLGLIDESAAIEAIRNVLVSPLADIDGQGDARAAAKRLEAVLAANSDFQSLPAKFGFVIDGGGSLSLATVPADARFDWIVSKRSFRIGIGGRSDEAHSLGHCEAAEIPDIAARLARAFLCLGRLLPEPPRRMRDLIKSCGAKTIAAQLGLHAAPPSLKGVPEEPCPIGLVPFSGGYCFGAGTAFGHLDADMLDAAAAAAETFGSEEIRLTPWRALLLPFVRPEKANTLRVYLAARGFIVDRGDPRLAVAACRSASTCERGSTDTRTDALTLMFAARRLVKTGVALHVSGCAKSCARHPATPLTLIAHAGLYDLVADGKARDAGILSEENLTLAAVREKLETVAQKAERQSEPVP